MATWNETVDVFSSITDKLGKRIDSGIFHAVVALNMLGITTRQSCEGHLDWGVPYPWIDIEADLAIKHRLHSYLCVFYGGRETDFDTLLSFHGYRIRPQGAAFCSLLSREEQEQKLITYQTEMAAFTQFLKSLLPV